MLTFNATNSYGGATTVSAGTLREVTDNAIPAGSPITVDGATAVLDLNGHLQGDNSVQVTVNNGGSIIGGTLNASTYAFNTGTITSTLVNSSTIIKKTFGTVLIGGTNSIFTGNVTLSQGTLTVGNANALGSTGTTGGMITFSGGYLQYGSGIGSVDFSGRFMNAGTQRFNIDTNGNNVTFNTGLTAGVNSSFNKVGAGTLVLNGSTNYLGTGTVTAGTLEYGTSNAMTTGVVAVNGPAIIDMNGKNQTAANGLVVDGGGTITSLSGASMFTLTAGAATSIEARNGIIGVILGGNGSLNKTTSGTVQLTKSNTFAGNTVVSAGMLLLGDVSALGTSAVAVTGGILNLVNFTPTFSNGLSLTGGTLTGGTVTTGNNLSLLNGVISSVLAGSAPVTFFNSTSSTAASTVTLNGANTLSGAITIGGGSLTGGVLILGSQTALGSGTKNLTFLGGTTSDFIDATAGYQITDAFYAGVVVYDNNLSSGTNFLNYKPNLSYVVSPTVTVSAYLVGDTTSSPNYEPQGMVTFSPVPGVAIKASAYYDTNSSSTGYGHGNAGVAQKSSSGEFSADLDLKYSF